MPVKTKPKKKWGYSSRFVSKYEDIRRSQAARYPAKLGIELTPELEIELKRAINNFVAETTQFTDRPRLSEIRATLDTIQKSSNQLANALEGIDIDTARAIKLEGILDAEIKETIYQTKKHRAVVNVALHRLGIDKGGHPTENTAVTDFAHSLNEIYAKATGSKDITSLSLIKRMLKILGYKHWSTKSLNKAIQRSY